MDFILEFLGELLFEGALYTTTNRKISKWIRYPLLIIIFSFFAFIAFGLFALGWKLLAKQPLVSMIFFTLDGMIIYYGITFFKKKGKK